MYNLGIPSDLDEAHKDPSNGLLYFFKGDQFYIYDGTQARGPFSLCLFDGIPCGSKKYYDNNRRFISSSFILLIY
jgi:hypothetical protein